MRHLGITKLTSLRIRPRNVAMVGILAAIAILAVIATLTLVNLRSTSGRLDAISRHTEVGAAYADMSVAIAQAQIHSEYFSLSGDPSERTSIVQAIRDALDADARVKASGTDADRTVMNDLEARFGPQLSTAMQLLSGGELVPDQSSPADSSALLNAITNSLSVPAKRSRDGASAELVALHEGFKGSATRILVAILLGLPIVGLLGLAVFRYERKDAFEASELKRLSLAALTDGLTGLANHRSFQEDLRREVVRASRTERALSVAMIDIDDFKEVNDTSGHARGDDVLAGLGKLMSLLRAEDRAYRIGGDEFALLLPEVGLAGALDALGRLREAVAEGITGVTISIGVSSTESGTRQPMLLRDHADAALYEAKHRGKNLVVAYAPEMDRGSDITAERMTAIREVLSLGKVTMWFQPIFKLGTKTVLAFEALLRLPDSPQLSGPEEAFEIAQHMGRSLDLDMLCVNGALDTAQSLPEDCKIFINLDPATIVHAGFTPDLLVQLVEMRGIPRSQVVFELTEKTDAPLRILTKQLIAIHERGFGIALDDVGSGNSGLEMLRVMKFDYVKIDRTVILDAMDGGPGRAVILAIVAFARESGAYMIAEGIESQAMLDTIKLDEDGLRKFWVQGVQGFLFGKPRQSVKGYLSNSGQETRAAA